MCSHRRRRPALCCLVLLLAVGSACSSAATRSAADFWSDAEPDPVLDFDPPLQLPATATTFVDDFDAVVADQGPSRVAGADFTLDMRTPAGDKIALHYRIGGQRSVPVQRGDKVHLTTWHRVAVSHDVMARGLAITVQQAGTPGGKIVALVDTQGVVPPTRLPASLAAIRPTDTAAWQTSERVDNECDVALLHQKFNLGTDPGKAPAEPRLLPPGARVHVTDGGTTYDLVLLDNRRVIATTCVPEPAAWWGWAAVLVTEDGKPGAPPPAKTRDRGAPEVKAPDPERESP